MYFGKMKTKLKPQNQILNDKEAEIEENNKYRQGRSREQWERNYSIQNTIVIVILFFCVCVLAKLCLETVI
tara:strand:+ start:1569 stop:1781 length:213 start_codon:yes stop_codon:yes gene_type:complete